MFGALTILVIILAIIITAQNSTKDSKNPDTSLAKPSPTNSQAPSPTLTPTPSLKSNITPFDQQPPTKVPATSTPTSRPNHLSQAISDFQYPGSVVVSKTDNTLNLESSDDPKKITDWYKDKIKSMNMNVTTFVQTSTNGKVLNKLVGADGTTEVRVEIAKRNNSQRVNISVLSL